MKKKKTQGTKNITRCFFFYFNHQIYKVHSYGRHLGLNYMQQFDDEHGFSYLLQRGSHCY